MTQLALSGTHRSWSWSSTCWSSSCARTPHLPSIWGSGNDTEREWEKKKKTEKLHIRTIKQRRTQGRSEPTLSSPHRGGGSETKTRPQETRKKWTASMKVDWQTFWSGFFLRLTTRVHQVPVVKTSAWSLDMSPVDLHDPECSIIQSTTYYTLHQATRYSTASKCPP
jgi:hypothetical protein